MHPQRPNICQHPLNDACDLKTSIPVNNHETRERSTIYGYFCREHDKFGHYVVDWPASAPQGRP
jgi:hypothetical protein